MDKFKRLFLVNKKVSVFLFGILLVSIVFGSILPLFLSSSDKVVVSDYLTNFVSNIENYNYLSLFYNGLISNCGFLVVLWLLGISVIGCVIVLFLFFLKGFILGFSICSIIINYGVKGILLGFVYLFPHQIINIFVYGIMTCYSLVFSIKFILFLFKKYDFNVRFAFNRCFKVFCVNFVLLFISVLYESFLWPIIMVFVCKLLGL